jgi:hypothetical protein
MSNIERAESLSSRIAGLSESLECGDGGVRGDFRAALAEVDALAADWRGAVSDIRVLRAALIAVRDTAHDDERARTVDEALSTVKRGQ